MTLEKKINLSIAVLVILVLSFSIFLIYPLFSEIKNASRELILKKEDLLFFERNIENLTKFQVRYREIEPNLEKISSLFIDTKAPVRFISFLEGLAENFQFPIEISTAQTPKAKEDLWPSLSFTIKTIAPFSQFAVFLEKLENSPYLIEIQNLNIQRLTEKELQLKEFEEYKLGDVRISLSLKVFGK